MAFSILSKRMLEVESIKGIVDKTKNYAQIFKLSHDRSLDLSRFEFKIDICTVLYLKEYDSRAEKNFCYEFYTYQPPMISDAILNNYYYILPIVKYSEIKDDSEVISENDDTMTIQYGKGISSPLDNVDEQRKIDIENQLGNIVESGRKVTMFLKKDGEKIKLRVYKNKNSDEEYVFMNKNDDGTFDDTIDPKAIYVARVEPLTWTVDKKTGYAICNRPIFFTEKSKCPYEQSELAKFLESDEFAQELCVHPEKKEEKTTRFSSPFGERQEKLSLEQKIKRILMGGKRIPYLVGHPGIGKTQIAKSINKNCLSFNLATFNPDTFTGKTSIVPGDKTIITEGDRTIEHSEKGRTATAEPEWYTKLNALSKKCQETGERCVLLLDEFDKLTPNLQVFINGIVDDPRTIAGWEIPSNVDIILAGNTEEYSEASLSISGEVASRLSRIEVPTDAIDWLKWASKNNIDPIVKAYLHIFPKKIIHDVKDKNGEYDYAKSLTPRSWDQKISQELIAARSLRADPYLEPYMDSQDEKEFRDFMKMYFNLGIEDILKSDEPLDRFDLTHDQIQMIINCLIATATNEDEIVRALKFIKQNNLNEYQALFEKRWSEINNTEEDIKMLRLAISESSDYQEERGTKYGR